MLKRHIVLVGFMGCGKSTVGPLVAGRLGEPFVDLDREIERTAGMSIREIFAQEGEAGFRRRETESLRDVLARRPHVVAAGGGLVTQAENRRLLREKAATVWLRAPIDELLRRIARSSDRPLIQGDDGMERARRLYREREPLYAEADFHVDATLGPRQVAELIAAWAAQHGGDPSRGNEERITQRITE